MAARNFSPRWRKPAASAMQESRRYHRDLQIGPFSESEREMLLHRSSVERSERAFQEFCKKVKEEDCTRQFHQENSPNSREQPVIVMVHEEDQEEEEYLAFQDDKWAEIAAMYRRYQAAVASEERLREERAVQKLASQKREKAAQSKNAQGKSGTDTSEATRPPTKTQQSPSRQLGFKESNGSANESRQKVPLQRKNVQKAVDKPERIQRIRESLERKIEQRQSLVLRLKSEEHGMKKSK